MSHTISIQIDNQGPNSYTTTMLVSGLASFAQANAAANHMQKLFCGEEIESDIKVQSELERLAAIEAAARNLVKVKGRYHTEQAFKALAALMPNA